jgi:DNA-binding FadR family transcriptional regulator
MKAAFGDHRALLRAIESGDEEKAAACARTHLQAAQAYTLSRSDALTEITAELVRGGGSRPLRLG